MTREDEVRMVAGECLVDTTVAEYAIYRCGTARDAIAHLSVQTDDGRGRGF